MWQSSLKACSFFLFLLLALVLFTPSQSVRGSESEWQAVAPGIDYGEFYLEGPNHAYVARMERSNPNVILESSIAQGTLSGGLETVSDMARRYDQAIDYWGKAWGKRNRVVVAINGSFYNMISGVPDRGIIHSGWYVKRFTDLQNGSGFVWKLDRSAFIGQCVKHVEDKQFITFIEAGETQYIGDVNVSVGEDEMVLFTPQYGDRTPALGEDGVEVLVEMTQPSMVLPNPDMAVGYVRAVRIHQGSTPIPFDHVVLVGRGQAKNKLLNYAKEGTRIGITQSIKHYTQDCSQPLDLSWKETYASVGGSFNFLKDGEIQSFDDLGALERHPRTAIAFNDDYIFFIVVDGRDPANSVGMNMDELGLFARDVLGATWGINQDGGGSSTMVVNGEVKNNTYCNNYFCQGATGKSEPLDEGMLEVSAVGEPVQRYVANGMMMVFVEPMQRSSRFAEGTKVVTIAPSDVRLGPGTNYGVLASLPSGVEGTVVAHLNQLDGVLAKGAYWWKVAFGDVVGWVDEAFLLPSSGRLYLPHAVKDTAVLP